MQSAQFFLPTDHGPVLSLRRTMASTLSVSGARPVLIVPGYGMNSFVFGYHPTGRSLETSLSARGLDVWSVDLRGQGKSTRGPSEVVTLGDLAVDDLGAAIDLVLRESGASKLDLVGCSLGAALAFTHLALKADAPVGSVVSMGGLVTWKAVHPLVKVAFASPWLAGKLRFRGTRLAARYSLPALAKFAPGLLSIYINPKSTDISSANELAMTVEDPVPSLNREIAEWVNRGDLLVRGVNVSSSLRSFRHPVMCVVGRQDGVVPEATSRAIYDECGAAPGHKELLLVGDDDFPVAHADMFVAREAESRIFAPVADFLKKHQIP